MTKFRTPVVRLFRNHFTSNLRNGQRRWARVHDVRFVATQQNQESIIDRYKDKLNEKVKREGFNDIDELKDAYKEKIIAQRKKQAVAGADDITAALESRSRNSVPSELPRQPPPPPAQPLDQLSPSSPHFKPPGVKTLSSFLDVQKTLDLPPREIEAIWRLRHAHHPNSLCATIPIDTYNAMILVAKRHPQFILPIPREGVGAEIHFLQWTFPAPDTVTVLFTHLAEYKLRGEFSQPHTTITHHLELAHLKGLVLLQGTVVEGRGVTVDEGKWLLLCMQKFYAQGRGEVDEKRTRLLEQFSQGKGDFKVEELLEEAEKIV